MKIRQCSFYPLFDFVASASQFKIENESENAQLERAFLRKSRKSEGDNVATTSRTIDYKSVVSRAFDL